MSNSETGGAYSRVPHFPGDRLVIFRGVEVPQGPRPLLEDYLDRCGYHRNGPRAIDEPLAMNMPSIFDVIGFLPRDPIPNVSALQAEYARRLLAPLSPLAHAYFNTWLRGGAVVTGVSIERNLTFWVMPGGQIWFSSYYGIDPVTQRPRVDVATRADGVWQPHLFMGTLRE